MSALTDFRAGWSDLMSGLRRWHLLRLMAWYDISRKNVDSRIGVLWNSLTFFMVAASLGYLYAVVFGRPRAEYVPWLAAGFVGWRYISQMMTEGLGVVRGSRGVLTQIPIPVSVFVYRAVLVQLLTLGLNLLGFVAVMAVFGLTLHTNPMLLLTGLTLLAIAGVGVTLWIGILGVLQPWLQNVLPAVVQLSFFVTPIIWMPSSLVDMGGGAGAGALRTVVLDYNPLYHYLEVFRGPLLGQAVPASSWTVAVTLSTLLLLSGAWALGRYKDRMLIRL